MKKVIAIVATMFAVSVFAQTAPVAPAKKEAAKPTAKAATPAKSEAKAPVTKDAKAAK